MVGPGASETPTYHQQCCLRVSDLSREGDIRPQGSWYSLGNRKLTSPDSPVEAAEPPALLQRGRKLRPQSQAVVSARDPGHLKRPHGVTCAGHPGPHAVTSWTRGLPGPRGPGR